MGSSAEQWCRITPYFSSCCCSACAGAWELLHCILMASVIQLSYVHKTSSPFPRAFQQRPRVFSFGLCRALLIPSYKAACLALCLLLGLFGSFYSLTVHS